MDIVKLVDGAVSKLPEGDHSAGLSAVQRHIAAAIKHFERASEGQYDLYTDAIYRTNQAFEGGLKEAYRVLAEKDPAKLTPYQIETYLENNRLIRPRALKQLTRYREDYRNPSTHDYKLDFDADEALLAIVAVCAFTRLLVSQITGKLSYAAVGADRVEKILGGSAEDFLENLLGRIGQALALRNFRGVEQEEFDTYLSEVLSGQDLQFDTGWDKYHEEDEEPAFDFDITSSHGRYVIETRILSKSDLEGTVQYIKRRMTTTDRDGYAIIVIDDASDDRDYKTFSISFGVKQSLLVLSVPSGKVAFDQSTKLAALIG